MPRQVQPLDQEDPLEEDTTSHFSIPAQRIPYTKEPGRLQSIELHRVRHDCSNIAPTHTGLMRKETSLGGLVWIALRYVDFCTQPRESQKFIQRPPLGSVTSLVQLGSTPHFCIKAVLLEQLRGTGRQAEARPKDRGGDGEPPIVWFQLVGHLAVMSSG